MYLKKKLNLKKYINGLCMNKEQHFQLKMYLINVR